MLAGDLRVRAEAVTDSIALCSADEGWDSEEEGCKSHGGFCSKRGVESGRCRDEKREMRPAINGILIPRARWHAEEFLPLDNCDRPLKATNEQFENSNNSAPQVCWSSIALVAVASKRTLRWAVC